MRKYSKPAFIGFLIVGILLIGMGLRYQFASRVMPYHLEAMESKWEDLSKGVQVLHLNYIKCAAAGFLATGVAILFLLAIPFRKGERWASILMGILILSEVGLVGYRSLLVGMHTPASPPLAPIGGVFAVGLISTIISLRTKN